MDRIEKWFRNEPIFSIAILLGLAVISTAEVVKHGTRSIPKMPSQQT